MKILDAVWPTLAVVFFWTCIGIVLAGCGFLIRRLLARLMPAGRSAVTLRAVDSWIGLAGLAAYLLLWNLWFAVTWIACVPPAALGAAGAVLGGRRLVRGPRPRLSPAVLVVGGAAILWLANASLTSAQDYDYGLYHLNLIEYAKHYAALPGLADLHTRLGAGDVHLLFVALIDHGPLAGAAPHLADGLLAALLVVDLCARLATRPRATWLSSFTGTLGLLLLPTTIIVAALRPTHRISSPNLDFAAFVLVVVGMLYLAECVERGFSLPAALGSTSALSTAAATRPLYWLWVGFAVVVLCVRARPGQARSLVRSLRTAAFVGVLPGLIAIGWLARQAVLSGYPLYPLTLGGLPVDWRLPARLLQSQTRADYAWARDPGVAPSVVFSSWHWLTGPWFALQSRTPDVLLPLALVALIVAVAIGGGLGPALRERRGVMLIVVLPSLASLAIWFALIPDPRFVWAPIWLIPLALIAWLLPPVVQERGGRRLLAAVAIGVGLAVFACEDRGRFVPVVFVGAVAAALVLRLSGRRRWLAGIVPLAVLSLLIADFGAAAFTAFGGIRFVSSDHSGPIGIAPDPVPTLVPVRTASGLQLSRPSDSDQCWQALLCIPGLPDKQLHLRGSTVADGFSLRAPPAHAG